MSPNATTVRLDPKLKKAVMTVAKEDGLSLSGVITMMLQFYAKGKVKPQMVRYPKWFADEMKRESKETMQLYKEGKIRGYTSVEDMMHDILS